MVSAEITVLNKVGTDDAEVIKDLLSLHFKSLDDPKAQTAASAASTATDPNTASTDPNLTQGGTSTTTSSSGPVTF